MIYLFSLYQTSTVYKKIDFNKGIISPVANVHQTKLQSGFSDYQEVYSTGSLQVIHCANLSAGTHGLAGIRHLNYIKNEL